MVQLACWSAVTSSRGVPGSQGKRLSVNAVTTWPGEQVPGIHCMELLVYPLVHEYTVFYKKQVHLFQLKNPFHGGTFLGEFIRLPVALPRVGIQSRIS